MLMLAIGAFGMWVVLGIIAIISENSSKGGITLFDGWGTTILCLPIILPCYAIGAILGFYKKHLTKRK